MSGVAIKQPNSLSREAVAYGIGGSAVQILNLILLPAFARIFSTEQFGTLDILLTLNALAVMVALMGLNSSVFFYYQRADAPASGPAVAGNALVTAVAAGCVVAVLGWIASPFLAQGLFGSSAELTAVRLAFLWVPAGLLASMALDLLRLQFRPVAYGWLNLVRAAVAGVAGIVAAGPLGLGVGGLIAAHVGVAALIGVAGLWIARDAWSWRIEPEVISRLLRFGVPLIPAGVALWTVAYVDRFLLIEMRGPAEAGIYAMANRLASALLIVVYAFEAAWWPFAFARANEADIADRAVHVFRVLGLVMLLLAGIAGLFAREALLVLTTPAYLPAFAFVGALAIGVAVNAITQVLSLGVQLAHRTARVSIAAVVGAVVNVAVCAVAIPQIGISGAVIGTLASYAAWFGALLWFAQRAFPIPYQLGLVMRFAVLVAIAIVAAILLDLAAAEGTWAPWVTAVKIGVAAGLMTIALGPMGLSKDAGSAWRTSRTPGALS